MEKRQKAYLLFVTGNPPQRLFSTVDLIASFQSQLKDRAKTGDWWRPIEFVDDTDNRVVAVYAASAIIGIVEGVISHAEDRRETNGH